MVRVSSITTTPILRAVKVRGEMRRGATVALLGLMLYGSARASLITIAASGTFDASAPTGALTAPGAPWSFNVTLDSQPDGIVGGPAFEVAQFYDFNYILNGTTVALRPNQIQFGAAAYPYLEVDFGVFVYGEFEFLTSSSFYSGTTVFPGDCGCASPTLIPGDYPTVAASFEGLDDQGNLISIDAGTTNLDVSAPASEASSFLLTSCTLGALGLLRRKAVLAFLFPPKI
jgi:hypothetical protein